MLKALAHPIRLRIVAILCDQDEHVSNLAKRLNLNQAMVSQQLRILRMRGLVKATRKNGYAHYELGKSHLKQMVSCIETCLFDRGATIP
jgi:ArsR family transcriptional regulator